MRNLRHVCFHREPLSGTSFATCARLMFFVLLLSSTTTASANDETYRPIFTQALGETALQPFAYVGSQTEWVSGLELEGNKGNVDSHVSVDLVARVGLRFHTMTALSPAILALQVEGDVPTGTLTSPLPFPDQDMPHSTPLGFRLRRAGLKIGYQDIVHVAAGLSTPQWGLGMVYNNGEERWQPGQMHLTTPREGDRALRALIGTGKLTPAKLQFGLGWEMPLEPEEPIELRPIHNLLLSATLEPVDGSQAGLLLNVRLGREHEQLGLGYWMADAFVKFRLPVGSYHLALGLELAVEGGNAASPVTGNIRTGGLLRTQFGSRTWGIGLDAIYASQKNEGAPSFRLDRQLRLGWLMFPYLGRIHQSLVTAPQATLTPAQGAIENILGGQLKGRWRPMKQLETLVGVLFAMRPSGTAGIADWSSMGTEVNLGLRWQGLFSGFECILGLDGAVVLPMAYLATDEPTYGARFFVETRL